MKRKTFIRSNVHSLVPTDTAVCTQAIKVYRLIKKHGYITRLTAFHNGIANLTARIADLRRAGVQVLCEIRSDEYGREYGRWFIPSSDRTQLVERQ